MNLAAAIARVFCAVLALCATHAHALETPSPEVIALATIDDALRAPLAARGATATVRAAAPDARRSLASCAKPVGFLPPGARLVGKTTVGVRCADGSTWQTFVAVDVHVDGPVWTTTRALRAGDVIGAGDLVAAVGALTTADFDPNPRGLATLDGRGPAPVGSTAQRATGTGRALVRADVRQDGRIEPGDAVRVVYSGTGFAVTAEGRAVGAADPGATLLVRLGGGSVVTGRLRDDRKVELQR